MAAAGGVLVNSGTTRTLEFNEAQSRYVLIDPGLRRAVWNMEIIKVLRFPLPPLSAQRKFAALVEHHERLRTTEREALRQAEHLFQGLLQRAFNPKS